MVLVHKGSGIRTWVCAVDLRHVCPDEDDFDVLFHYTTPLGFANITAAERKDNEIFASLEDKRSSFGHGAYAVSKEPLVFGSQEAVLLNNYWPRCGNDKADKN